MRLLLVLLVSLVCISSIPLIHAEDRFNTMRVIHKDNPTVCIMEPTEELQVRYYSHLLQIAFDSVMEWQTDMYNFTDGDWYMPMRLYDYEDHFDKDVRDFPECDVFIEYADINPGDVVNSSALAYTSFDFSRSVHQYSYVKIYVQAEKISSNIAFCLGCNEGLAKADITSKKSHEYLDQETIRKIMLHEIGHALGLGHYIEDKDKNNNESSIMYPYMKAFGIDNSGAEIELADKIMMREMYHKDGFGGHAGFTPKYFEINSLLKDFYA